jgi:lipid-binding SYLF domain-containing protein
MSSQRRSQCSIREAANQRIYQHSLNTDDSDDEGDYHHGQPQLSHHNVTMSYSQTISSWQQQHQPQLHQEYFSPQQALQQQQFASPAENHQNGASAVGQARNAWKNGTGPSQLLEEQRASLTALQFLQQQVFSVVGSPCTLRVSYAVQRWDATKSEYTAYVIQFVPTANVCERRYSDFARLQRILQPLLQQQPTNAPKFPAKHWAGTWNATTASKWAIPAQILAPAQQHADLVADRVQLLDAWLVQALHTLFVLQAATQHDHVIVAALREFFMTTTTPAPPRGLASDAPPTLPPCDRTLFDAFLQPPPSSDHTATTTASSSSWKWHNPVSGTLSTSIRQAIRTAQSMMFPSPGSTNNDSSTIPLDLLHHARGLCFLTVMKAGFVVSGRIGTGLLTVRLNDGQTMPRWSAPCAIKTMGMGWGAQIGGDITHYLLVLTTDEAVQSIVSKSSSSIQLGAELDVAAGPLGGRAAQSHLSTSTPSVKATESVGRTKTNHGDGSWSDYGIHPAYSYAHSHGLFVGLSLEGSILSIRQDVNTRFYGQKLTPAQILSRPTPRAAEPLQDVLNAAYQQPIADTGSAFRPSQLWMPHSPDSAVESFNYRRDPPMTSSTSIPVHPTARTSVLDGSISAGPQASTSTNGAFSSVPHPNATVMYGGCPSTALFDETIAASPTVVNGHAPSFAYHTFPPLRSEYNNN